MVKKTDTLTIRILELIALLGEATSDEIKSFSNSPSYAEKMITSMKKESYIKNFKKENKSTYRLMSKGKRLLSESLPEIFSDSFEGQKSMNRVRDDKRREERRSKLAEILLLFHRADVKIFPDEKTLLKNTAESTRTDTTDILDEQRPEFYTSMEIKNIIPDYKKGIGSRTLGILISHGKLYIVYLTVDGNLFWRKEMERAFFTNTKNVLAKRLFGKDNGTYLLVISRNEKVPAIIMNRNNKTSGKIHPSADLQNMIFALKDTERDATLDFILSGSKLPDKYEDSFRNEFVFDKKNAEFDGVKSLMDRDMSGNITTTETFGVCAYMFDLRKVANAVESTGKGRFVEIFCFDFQKQYIEELCRVKKDEGNKNLIITTYSIEGHKERCGL